MIATARQMRVQQILDIARQAVAAVADEDLKERLQEELDGLTERVEQSVVTLRMDKRLHRQLRHQAFTRETSLNRLCVAILEASSKVMNDEEREEAGDAA